MTLEQAIELALEQSVESDRNEYADARASFAIREGRKRGADLSGTIVNVGAQ